MSLTDAQCKHSLCTEEEKHRNTECCFSSTPLLNFLHLMRLQVCVVLPVKLYTPFSRTETEGVRVEEGEESEGAASEGAMLGKEGGGVGEK